MYSNLTGEYIMMSCLRQKHLKKTNTVYGKNVENFILFFLNFFSFSFKVTVTSQFNWDKPRFKQSTKGINQHRTTYWYLWYYVAENNYLPKVNKKETEHVTYAQNIFNLKHYSLPGSSVFFVDLEKAFVRWNQLSKQFFVQSQKKKYCKSCKICSEYC